MEEINVDPEDLAHTFLLAKEQIPVLPLTNLVDLLLDATTLVCDYTIHRTLKQEFLKTDLSPNEENLITALKTYLKYGMQEIKRREKLYE